jgi:hypothetical protein
MKEAARLINTNLPIRLIDTKEYNAARKAIALALDDARRKALEEAREMIRKLRKRPARNSDEADVFGDGVRAAYNAIAALIPATDGATTSE